MTRAARSPRTGKGDREKKILSPKGTCDDVFRVLAVEMKAAVAAKPNSNSKRTAARFVAEILYQGRRHEAWLMKNQIVSRGREALAGYLKSKCLQG